MRLQLLGLVAGLLGLVSALSAQGNKLLVVIEDEAEKSKYSQFWTDLESKLQPNRQSFQRDPLLTRRPRSRLPAHLPLPERNVPFPPRRTSLLPPPAPPTQVQRLRSRLNTQPPRRLCQRRLERPPRSLRRPVGPERNQQSAARARHQPVPRPKHGCRGSFQLRRPERRQPP